MAEKFKKPQGVNHLSERVKQDYSWKEIKENLLVDKNLKSKREKVGVTLIGTMAADLTNSVKY